MNYSARGCMYCEGVCNKECLPKKETTLTSEDFFRKKLKELNPFQSVITLSKELITAEQGMMWAKEYSDYINKKIEKMKEETLEEAAERYIEEYDVEHYISIEDFILGAKWQQEQYTIEERHIGHSIDELSKEYIKGFNEGSVWQQEQDKKLYTEQEVKYLLEVQRGNCYVALLSHTKNDDIASVALGAPEPGGRNGTWVK